MPYNPRTALLILGWVLITISTGFAADQPLVSRPLDKGTIELDRTYFEHTLRDVWVFSEEYAVAVGSPGLIHEKKGDGWREASHRLGKPINAVWGSSPDSVFAASSKGSIYFFDGESWTEVLSDSHPLNGIWGTSESDVFAVGRNGTIFHFDGKEWSVMPVDSDEHLLAIHGSSNSNVVAVGTNGEVLSFDGRQWTKIPGMPAKTLHSVWVAPSGGFVVGGNGGLVSIFDRRTWNDLPFLTENPVVDLGGSSIDRFFALILNQGLFEYDSGNWSVLKRFPQTMNLWRMDCAPNGRFTFVGSSIPLDETTDPSVQPHSYSHGIIVDQRRGANQ